MTLQPSTMAASATDIRDDDGQPVATIYANRAGVEIVCQQGYTAEFTVDREPLLEHLGVTFSRQKEHRR